MRKILTITLCILLILALTGCKPAVTSGTSAPLTSGLTTALTTEVTASAAESIPSGESPRIYLLTGDDTMTLMPTVTLYANGSARLSQPMISSMALFGLGHYVLDGDKLTVTYDEGATAEFTVSGGGDTLLLKDTNVGFTKIGSIYQYQSRADYLRAYDKIDGEELTLDTVRELAPKGSSLTYSDFEKYAHVDIDPDDHVYDIEGIYTLTVVYGSDGSTSITVENNDTGERFPLNLNGSTGLVFDEYLGITTIPKYTAMKWLDYYQDDKMPWDSSMDLTLPEYPDVTFTWTSEKVTANSVEFIWGMPVWNVYLTDLTNDGKPEICATVSIGSGISDTRVIVYDYVDGKEYQLADRMTYDYYLSFEDGKVMVKQCEYRQGKALVTSELKLVNGEIEGF
jgi:hypothetical protein